MFSALGGQEHNGEPVQKTHRTDASRCVNIATCSVSVVNQEPNTTSQTGNSFAREDDQTEPVPLSSTSKNQDLHSGCRSIQAKFEENPDAAMPVAPAQRITHAQRSISRIQQKTRRPKDSESLRVIMQRRRTEAKIDEWWANDRWIEEGFDAEESPHDMVDQEAESVDAEGEEQMIEYTGEQKEAHDSDDKMTEPDEARGAIGENPC